MLPVASRLTEADLFRRATRSGRRCGSATLVTHLLAPVGGEVSVLPAAGAESSAPPPVVGFVVSKAVGGAVVRNRVKRRLRHAVRERLHEVPGGSILVVRANPAAARASYGELDRELARCLRKLAPANAGA